MTSWESWKKAALRESRTDKSVRKCMFRKVSELQESDDSNACSRDILRTSVNWCVNWDILEFESVQTGIFPAELKSLSRGALPKLQKRQGTAGNPGSDNIRESRKVQEL